MIDGAEYLFLYVFTGGGRKIIRAEVSLDLGETWELATLRQTEKPTEFGMYWCWVFWEFEVEVSKIRNAPELWCRAWDESQNTQPQTLTWNLMGMMNNCYFKVRVHPGKSDMCFEQPTQPGAMKGGWMVGEDGGPRENMWAKPVPGAARSAAAAPAAAPVAASTDASGLPAYTMEEVEKHNSAEDCWFVVDGLVYDSTKYNDTHPGGASSILLNAGEDASEEFNSIHSKKAKGLLKDWLIGKVAGGSGDAAPSAEPVAPSTPGLTQLTTLGSKKVKLPLAVKTQISPDTVILRFSLPSAEHQLGLPCGQHFFVYAKDAEGKLVIRAYTPITADNVKGYVDLLIKVYRPCDQFPKGGQMSQVLDKLSIGDSIEVKGPIGHFHYLGRGQYTKDHVPGTCTELSMIAGGTGITPMWQIASQILADPEDKTQVKLVFANRHEEDILLWKELEELASKHSNFSVHYTLSGRKPADWKYSTGRINEAMLKEHIFPASDTTLALLCGPQGMIDVAAKPNLTKMGYKESTFVEF